MNCKFPLLICLVLIFTTTQAYAIWPPSTALQTESSTSATHDQKSEATLELLEQDELRLRALLQMIEADEVLLRKMLEPSAGMQRPYTVDSAKKR